MGDIKYFLNKPFKIYSTEEGVLYRDDRVIDNIFWIEECEESPNHYHVCWNTFDLSSFKRKVLTTYGYKDILNNFNKPDVWVWKFID